MRRKEATERRSETRGDEHHGMSASFLLALISYETVPLLLSGLQGCIQAAI